MTISQLISKLAVSHDTSAVAQLEAMFAASVFGLLMTGLPKAAHGQKVLVDGSGSVTMQWVCDPNGKRMIKACADPDLFSVNYPGSINVTMTGRELLEMVEKLPEADGILICSATSLHSFPIYRAAYPRVRGAKPIVTRRKWWQFWLRQVSQVVNSGETSV
jgi:hypothetical protein